MIRDWRNASNFGPYGNENFTYFSAGDTMFWVTASGNAVTKKIQGLFELEYVG
jgi:hypothetical protein